MNAPNCRGCEGDGEVFTGARYLRCETCQGVGVEICGECQVDSPRALVVATYDDTCSDGSEYRSQVCAACAQRLTGLIETDAHNAIVTRAAARGTLDGTAWRVQWPATDPHHARRRAEEHMRDLFVMDDEIAGAYINAFVAAAGEPTVRAGDTLLATVEASVAAASVYNEHEAGRYARELAFRTGGKAVAR